VNSFTGAPGQLALHMNSATARSALPPALTGKKKPSQVRTQTNCALERVPGAPVPSPGSGVTVSLSDGAFGGSWNVGG
jgi:hypothetical protein